MKISSVSAIFLTSLFILGCSSTKKVAVANQKIDQMMAQKSFVIEMISARPMITQAMTQVANSGILPPGSTIGRMDINGSGYFIKVKGDSVSANLPYFGERQMGGGYGSADGIVFDGITKDLSIEKNTTKQNYELKFSITSNSESYFINITVGNKGTSTTDVLSSQRNRIRYTGEIQEEAEKGKEL